MTPPKKKNVISRPAPKPLVPKGVARLLGEEEEETEKREEPKYVEEKEKEQQEEATRTKKRKIRPEDVRKPEKKEKEEKRVTFALRYRESYMDKLEKLYLKRRGQDRKCRKADIVEEALDLLFEKYKI